jgi:hypothetical protein
MVTSALPGTTITFRDNRRLKVLRWKLLLAVSVCGGAAWLTVHNLRGGLSVALAGMALYFAWLLVFAGQIRTVITEDAVEVHTSTGRTWSYAKIEIVDIVPARIAGWWCCKLEMSDGSTAQLPGIARRNSDEFGKLIDQVKDAVGLNDSTRSLGAPDR